MNTHLPPKPSIMALLLSAMALAWAACGHRNGQDLRDAETADASGLSDGQIAHDGSLPEDGATDGGETRPPHNQGSPLGTNLTDVTDYSTEWTFVDAFKASRPWISGSSSQWSDGRAIDVDAQGWVLSLEADQIARTLLFWGDDPHYPAGRYVVLFEGSPCRTLRTRTT